MGGNAETPGHIAGDKLWHIYRYSKKVGTSPMTIGSILTDPENPESSLNFSSKTKAITPPAPKDTFDETSAIRLAVSEHVSKNSGADLSASLSACFGPLVLAGASVEADRSRRLQNSVEALGVEAEIILQDTAKEYVDSALGLQKLKGHVAQNWLHAPSFYLIVGVATCKSLIRTTAVSQESSGSAHVKASIGPSGAEASGDGRGGREAGSEVELEIGEECAFAYRVREFQYSKTAKRQGARGPTSGAGHF